MKQTYKDLIVWQKGIALVTQVYRITRTFPKDELYGLTSQLRRAAVSIPSNLAEGQGRLSTREFRQFTAIAKGSLHELETQLIIARDLGYLDTTNPVFEQLQEVARLLNGLLNSLSSDNRPPTPD